MHSATQTTETKSVRSASIFWPEQILGPRPGLKEVNLLCWAMFIVFLVVPLCVVHWIQAKQGNDASIQLNSDFVLYYGDGILAREYPAVEIYHPALQRQVFNRIHPSSATAPYGVSSYPPVIPLFFSLLARLPFTPAYFLWMAISLALYCAGVWAVASIAFPGDRLKLSLIFCFALAFYPFIAETLANGQLAAIAVFAAGLAIYQERHRRCFYGGLALALLTYKPTLLVFIFPMLLLTRRFRMFWGFVCGALALTMAGTAYGGLKVWPAYIALLRFNSHLAGLHGGSAIRLQMYLDFSSVSHLLPGGRSTGVLIAGVILAAGIAALLFYLLWRSNTRNRPIQWLAWAAVLTWTLMLNVYVPIYDSVLVVLALVLTLGALRELDRGKASEWTTFLAVLIFAVSWVTKPFAKTYGIQLMTVLLFVLGAAQLYLLNQAIRQNSTEARPVSA